MHLVTSSSCVYGGSDDSTTVRITIRTTSTSALQIQGGRKKLHCIMQALLHDRSKSVLNTFFHFKNDRTVAQFRRMLFATLILHTCVVFRQSEFRFLYNKQNTIVMQILLAHPM